MLRKFGEQKKSSLGLPLYLKLSHMGVSHSGVFAEQAVPRLPQDTFDLCQGLPNPQVFGKALELQCKLLGKRQVAGVTPR